MLNFFNKAREATRLDTHRSHTDATKEGQPHGLACNMKHGFKQIGRFVNTRPSFFEGYVAFTIAPALAVRTTVESIVEVVANPPRQ